MATYSRDTLSLPLRELVTMQSQVKQGLFMPDTVKNKIAVGGGVIDPDYDGEVKVILFNHGMRISP